MRRLDVVVDGSTARLLKAAQGLQHAELLPASSSKTLVGLAKAVREFTEAQERPFAASLLKEIDELAKTAKDEDEGLAAMLQRRTDAVRKALHWNERQES